MANRSPSHYPDIGVLGEDLVTQWLCSEGWVILHRRWRCRWGEIDIIATKTIANRREDLRDASPFLVFVEVKTRSRGNWDAGGLLSITPKKQTKLWQTARCFLGTYTKLAKHTCRFDVALVCCQKLSTRHHGLSEASHPVTAADRTSMKPVHLGQATEMAGYQMILQDYIPAAFD